jgi:hypothetical protein
MTQYKYNQQEGRIVANIPKPNPPAANGGWQNGEFDMVSAQYDKAIKRYNTRPSYPVSPELKKVWEDGVLKTEGVDFNIKWICNHCNQDDRCGSTHCEAKPTAIPIPAVESMPETEVQDKSGDMTVEEFYSQFNMDFLSDEEKQTIYTATELYTMGKLKQKR